LRFAVSVCLAGALIAGNSGFSQTTTATKRSTQQKSAPVGKKPAKKLTPQQQFVLDVVQWAVALPAGDQQDRLRILTAATEVIGPVNSGLARQYAREGAKVEAGIIASGEKPDVSILSAGHFDCAGAAEFVAQVPITDVVEAEQSLINVLSACPKEGTDPVRQKLDLGMSEGELAPRGLMAVMERAGATSPWSRDAFSKMFKALPADAKNQAQEAPNYAAMYSAMAPQMDKEAAKSAGLSLLDWLGKLDEGGDRNLAVNITTDTLKKCLGDEAYSRALESDVIARGVANTAGKPGEVSHPEEENVSVLAAMANNGTDQSSELEKMPSSLRAREAAAHGFATGTAGDKSTASRYFDIAFSAADEVWNDRESNKNAPAVIQEVSEAAAHVDSVDALKRAQHLSDPAAQAIGMLSVARVVLSSGSGEDMSPHPAAASTGSN
jgi:hypothetical protein